jgi:protein CpxP
MKIRRTAAVLAVLAALGATGALLAGTTTVVRRGAGGDRAGMMDRLVDDPSVQDRLKLTSEQIEQLRTIRDESRESVREMRAAVIRARADLRAMMLDTKASRQELEKSAAAVREARNAASQEVTKRLLDARDVLSVDQREELRSIIKERVVPARRRFWRGHRHPVVDGDLDGAGADDGALDTAEVH